MTDTDRLNDIENYEISIDFTGDEPHPWRIRVGIDTRTFRTIFVTGENVRETIDRAFARRQELHMQNARYEHDLVESRLVRTNGESAAARTGEGT